LLESIRVRILAQVGYELLMISRGRATSMNLRQKLRTPALQLNDLITYPIWKTFWRDHVEYLWFASRNWGDALNPVLIRHLSGRAAHGIDFHMRDRGLAWPHQPDRYAVIGSILQLVDRQTTVWGVGFMSSTARVGVSPRRVCAVRGPLSASKLRDQGIACPDVYGDPALLYPKFYHPRVRKAYRLGLIPHYLDSDSPLLEPFRNDESVLIIDIRGGIRRVMDELVACEAIASTSLHGLIMADAYQIPSVWIKMSNKIHGDDFKFHDYFASQGKTGVAPKWVEGETRTDDLLRECHLRECRVDLDRLLDSCPFRGR
jgi:pyruvyltransferase